MFVLLCASDAGLKGARRGWVRRALILDATEAVRARAGVKLEIGAAVRGEEQVGADTTRGNSACPDSPRTPMRQSNHPSDILGEVAARLRC